MRFGIPQFHPSVSSLIRFHFLTFELNFERIFMRAQSFSCSFIASNDHWAVGGVLGPALV